MSIQKVISPLLIISYVCGLRVIEFSAGVSRQYFGLLYMFLVWSLYIFAYICGTIFYTNYYPILYHVWFGVNTFIALLSIILGLYYNKTFKNCMRNLTAVNDTLEKMETITDYKLYMKIKWLILGWFMIALLIFSIEIRLVSQNIDIVQTICISFMHIYCIHINIITDLTITSMLGYIGLKFDQINEHLEKLTEGNKRRIKQAWRHPVLLFHQSRYTRAEKSKVQKIALRKSCITWIVIHLYSELRKISRKIDLIFGTQMTIEMGCYFAFIALGFQEVFNMILLINYNNEIIYVIIILVTLFLHVFRLFLVNYECEKVSVKANATGNFISKLSYSNCDAKIRENILQFLLMTQSPLRFYGLGLFQFGFKFLQKFTMSVATVLVILLQTYQ